MSALATFGMFLPHLFEFGLLFGNAPLRGGQVVLASGQALTQFSVLVS